MGNQSIGVLSVGRRWAVLAVAALAAAAFSGAMWSMVGAQAAESDTATQEVHMFLAIEGISGEATARGHEGEIEVLSWEWGMANTGTMHAARGGGAGRSQVSDIEITKFIDRATPRVMETLLRGSHIPSAVLTVQRGDASPGGPYLVITMEDVLVTSYQTGGSSGDSAPTETMTLNFAKVHFEYTEQRADGRPGETVSTGWDVPANQAWQPMDEP